ncbi:choice-of-anchor J domain-containing protein [Bacteroidota bacterium]
MICTFVLILFPTVGVTQSTDTLWTEGWEGNWIDDWNITNGTWQVGTPTSGPGGAYAGQNCAATVLDGNYPDNADTRIEQLNSFIVPSAELNPRLRFWHYYFMLAGDVGVVQIKVGTGNWITISPTYTLGGGGGIWTYPSIDLTEFADLSVRIAFHFVSGETGNTYGWYIDEISVITGPLNFNNPEGWESGLGDWYADRGTWEIGAPTSGPGGAYTGQNCAATILDGTYSNSIDSRLISPPFQVSPLSENPRLRIWHWYSFGSGDMGEVQIKYDSGSWQTILGPYTQTGGGVWSPTTTFLDAYADSIVQFAFHFVSNSGSNESGWYVDDITIVSDIIPVEFASFTSTIVNGKIQLDWTTATETNNKGFEVERSIDKTGWEKLIFIEGNGTTTELSEYSFIDKSHLSGTIYYRLKQIDFDGTFEYSDIVEIYVPLPEKYVLSQNRPNPFNPTTEISFTISKAGDVKLLVFNSLGEVVTVLLNEYKNTGRYSVTFDASNFSSGIYFYRLQAGDFLETKKMVLMK